MPTPKDTAQAIVRGHTTLVGLSPAEAEAEVNRLETAIEKALHEAYAEGCADTHAWVEKAKGW